MRYIITKSFQFIQQCFLRLKIALSEGEEPGLFEEIWEYLTEKYFSVKFYEYDYQHIPVSDGSIITARGAIVAIMLGIIVASAISMFQKRTLGDLVRALCREDCYTPEKAMTFEELGLLRNAAIKEDMRHGSSLKRVVRCVEEEQYKALQKEKYQSLLDSNDKVALKKWKEIPFTYDFYNHHFYIPKDLSYGADIQFDKRGTNPIVFIFVIIACVIFTSAVCFWLPEILQYADNFIGILSNN